MTDIAALEARLAAAMERIAHGLAAFSDAPPASAGDDGSEVAALRLALEEEKTANAQLNERVRAIREKQDMMVDQLEKRVLRLQDRVATQEAEIGQLRRVNAQLRENSKVLREAAAGSVDAHFLNRTMMTELEATRAAQAADRSELDAIIAELVPLVEESSDV